MTAITTKTTKWPYVIIGVLLAIVLFLSLQTCSSRKEQENYTSNLIKALNDSLYTYKNKDARNTSRIFAIETYNINAFTKLEIKDSEIVKLQRIIKDYEKGSKHPNVGISISGTTDYNNFSATDYLSIDEDIDPVHIDTNHFMYAVFPTYKASSDNGWIKYNVVATKDSTNLDIHIENTYSVVLGKDKNGSFAEVTNYNPYSTNKVVRAFQLTTPKPKRWGIGIGAGVGVNSSFKLRPQVNLGLNYNFLNF